jgi:hypothetical protein
MGPELRRIPRIYAPRRTCHLHRPSDPISWYIWRDRQAARVVSNRVYQCMAVGKPVITGRCAGSKGLLLHKLVNDKTCPKSYGGAQTKVGEIDFGDYGKRRSSAQITDNYRAEDLVGRQIMALMNLSAKQIAGVKLELLVLAAVCRDQGTVLLAPDRKVKPGTRIS